MPTTPNPTGGYFVMVPKASVRELDMSVDDALKYIISMGVVAPHRRHPRARTRGRRAGTAADVRRQLPKLTGQHRRAAASPRAAAVPGAARPDPNPPTPFQPQRPPENALKRTDYCGRIDRRHLAQTVTLMGWVHRRRDHGGVIFVDLRDREGLVQVVCDPDRAATFAIAETLRNEFVIRVTGLVRPRPEGGNNPNLVSGEIEVLAHDIEILNAALTPPFQLDDENLSETVRLAASRARPAPAADAEEPDAAPPRGDVRAPLPRRARLHRHRDADALQVDARGRARVPRAVAHPSRTCSTRCRSRRSCSSRC